MTPRKVKQLQFINGMGTVNLRNVPKMSLNAEKDMVDITLTDIGYFIKYADRDETPNERFMPLSIAFDVQLYPIETVAAVETKKTKTVA